MWLRSWAMLVFVATSVGCLAGKTTSTVYIETDDSISWTILETDVRSNADEAAMRERQEREFIRAAKRGEHDTVGGFDLLAPDEVDTVILRDERPFSVATTARFRSLERLARTVLDVLEVGGQVRIETTDELTRLEVEIDLPEADRQTAAGDEGSAAGESWFEELEIVVADGRFVESRGFVQAADDRVRFAASDELLRMAAAADGRLVLSLAWTHDAR
ncbi:MAG TPA: hypothetical protein VD788_17455 [Candidatus Polarisedimenticolaceae bacterium]|nr:hypothetical protein [Candidatus Polarisedimenticolaceae bacterium]